jgi:hypothetical protein
MTRAACDAWAPSRPIVATGGGEAQGTVPRVTVPAVPCDQVAPAPAMGCQLLCACLAHHQHVAPSSFRSVYDGDGSDD